MRPVKRSLKLLENPGDSLTETEHVEQTRQVGSVGHRHTTIQSKNRSLTIESNFCGKIVRQCLQKKTGSHVVSKYRNGTFIPRDIKIPMCFQGAILSLYNTCYNHGCQRTPYAKLPKIRLPHSSSITPCYY